MALTDENGGNGFYMPVAPAYAGNGGGFGNGFGGDWAWIILLLLLGWGNNGWGGAGNGGFGGGVGGLYPWLNNSNQINDGFRDAMINDNITEIRTGVTGLSNQLCNCCGDIQMALANGFSGVEQGANARQIANMQTAFGGQMAMAQGFNGVQSQLAQCCCDNRLATNDLKYTIATENCADRAAISDGLRDILTATQAQTQRILDQLCNDKIDSKNDTISQLRQELLYARGQASQDVQTAQILAGQSAIPGLTYTRLSECPVNSVPVYGRQPIFSCNNNAGCGCGCGGVA